MTEEEKLAKKREYGRKYREKNKERIAAQQKEWYEKNKERLREQQAKYREENLDQIKEYRERTRESKNARNREYMKGYYARKREDILAYQRSYYKANAEKVKSREAKRKTENAEYINAYNKKYRAEHKAEHSTYIKRRRDEDPKYKLICSIRNLLNNAFNKRTKVGKSKQAEEILGCTIEFFIEYLQSQFKEGMTLENHGEWHIDHIIPLSSAKTEEEVIKLNHYTNLQPLWAKENLQKRNKTS